MSTKIQPGTPETIATRNFSLSGIYSRTGSKLITPLFDFPFYILTRKKPTGTKPLLYVIAKTPGKDTYISSLYETDETGLYRMEYAGVIYYATLTETQCKIELR